MSPINILRSENTLPSFKPSISIHTKTHSSPMAAATLFRRSSAIKSFVGASLRNYASISEGTDLVAAAPNISLQKARSWDEGVSSKFATTSLQHIFKVIYTYMFVHLNIQFFLTNSYTMPYISF